MNLSTMNHMEVHLNRSFCEPEPEGNTVTITFQQDVWVPPPSVPQEPTRVIIADPNPFMREGVAKICQTVGLQVLSQCAEGSTALESIRSLRPDFALLEVYMPKLGGTQVVRKVRESECPTRCIILTGIPDESTIRESFEAGADGYLLKLYFHAGILCDAISYIRGGGRYISYSGTWHEK